MNDESCRCPNRPYSISWASGSEWEREQLARWDAAHAHHPYAKARDQLAKALQQAEGTVHSGLAVLDMVSDVYGIRRAGLVAGTTSAVERGTSPERP